MAPRRAGGRGRSTAVAAPTPAASPVSTAARPVVILENGGGYVRLGLAGDAAPRVVVPNCTASAKAKGGRTVTVGAAVLDLPSSDIHRPTQRGLLVDMDQQTAVWESAMAQLGVDARNCAVLASEPALMPSVLQREVEEALFEVMDFQEVAILPSPVLALQSPGMSKQADARNPCCTVLDLGFSGCVAVPCVEGQAITSAIRRSNVGGRVLTNLLVERLRVRQFDLTKSWLVAEDVLNKVGQVSLNFDAELRDKFPGVEQVCYVLPDFGVHKRGFVVNASAPAEANQSVQRLMMRAERVVVPEMLFRPQDHGVRQAGLAELVHQAIRAVPDPTLQRHFGQVLLCGGLARLPGLKDRLEAELRQLLPEDWPVRLFQEEAPELSAWRGAASLAASQEFRRAGFRTRRSREEEAGPGASTTRRGSRKRPAETETG